MIFFSSFLISREGGEKDDEKDTEKEKKERKKR
jgi:hypothetical protein